MAPDHTPVAVVGAGPYGLSLSAHLSAQHTAHRIFGRPMSMWSERMPKGMLLKSEGFASNLSTPDGGHTLRDFCRAEGREYQDLGAPVRLDTFVDYGRWFQQQRAPHVEPLDVVALERERGRFRLRLSDGAELTADRVVLAVGVGSFAHVPPELAGLPARYVSHSSAHHDLSRFAGKDVALVGGGQAALETAALLAEAGARPQVLVRKSAVHWNESSQGRSLWARLCAPHTGLGAGWKLTVYLRVPGVFRYLPVDRRAEIVRTKLGPAGAWWLKERVVDRVPVRCAMAPSGLTLAGERVRVHTQCGEEVEVDHVMAATGFRMDLAKLGFLAAPLRAELRTERGFPQLSRHFESSVPGLYFVGLPAALEYGPMQRFVYGARLAARRVSAGLEGARAQGAARAREPARAPGAAPAPSA
ncbi:hypothetical protein FGE12_13825 [Aggregicoccus sp. 17bor-14]|uniref:FAD-dependent oxidoreductase n=1 Tax=Myxococcaceae TaxID=31 RepID=UPI00129CA6D6|nr:MULTISPECIES: FAD-dependent oxidoreductase [Myxococcaceae]MBF5043471.1 FAD-dependent oxidoreductase [Simulacricoccus sp. 17bor-14]MRI89229.1 hypothetical protein [Aggregicoccus sp. 17bor-14]